MPDTDINQLQYFLVSKNGISVISFVGALGRVGTQVLDACLKELRHGNPKFVILNLRDLGNRVDVGVIPEIARFQKSIREMPSELRLCSIHPALIRALDENGVLRKTEVANNLYEALQGIQGPAG